VCDKESNRGFGIALAMSYSFQWHNYLLDEGLGRRLALRRQFCMGHGMLYLVLLFLKPSVSINDNEQKFKIKKNN